jgi:acetoin utilization deacetylase AcuC-like enzyme
VALATVTAIDELEVDRVLIVDWDIHHGNGTHHTFWEDPRVGFLSIHRYPFYPGTGHEDETGGGRGAGTVLNLPVEFGISREDYLAMFGDALDRFATQIKPDLIFISAGFDTHREDPVGSLGLETEDFATLTNTVLDVADAHAAGRVISVLEGGYNPPVLADCLDVHLAEMVKRSKT